MHLFSQHGSGGFIPALPIVAADRPITGQQLCPQLPPGAGDKAEDPCEDLAAHVPSHTNIPAALRAGAR